MEKQKLAVPIAIVVAGLLIAGTVYFTKNGKNNAPSNTDNTGSTIIDASVPNFSKCLSDGKFSQKVENFFQDGIKVGVNGTPHSIIINEKGEKFAIKGAYPYEQVKIMLDQIISGSGPAEAKVAIDELRVVDTSIDHILGNPDAPVTIIEFSDTECPFCKNFHATMIKIMDEYGKTGKVRLVYRHFPLDTLHDKSRKEAEATECAFEQGGNDKFWKFLDKIYSVTPSNNGLDPQKLFEIAKSIGLN